MMAVTSFMRTSISWRIATRVSKDQVYADSEVAATASSLASSRQHRLHRRQRSGLRLAEQVRQFTLS
jgi:hypothetical protein